VLFVFHGGDSNLWWKLAAVRVIKRKKNTAKRIQSSAKKRIKRKYQKKVAKEVH